jgi:hypothetical protein
MAPSEEQAEVVVGLDCEWQAPWFRGTQTPLTKYIHMAFNVLYYFSIYKILNACVYVCGRLGAGAALHPAGVTLPSLCPDSRSSDSHIPT